jgi:ATP/maltotriose-dependent transcriptional regulator MalT
VVLLTRADPLLPIAKLRSQHLLVELRSADLSFSANDIHFLFNRKLKLKLSLAEVQSLANKTEGWIAGLQLIALSLRDREDTAAFIQDFKGDNRYIMDYLIEEVLNQQPPEIKDFLLQTSLLEQLSGPLCDAVLDRTDSQSVLEMLEKNNMFIVSLDAERKWYRYHHLLPEEVIKKNPGFGLFYAWVLITAGKIEKAGPLLANGEEITRQAMAAGHAGAKAAGDHKKLLGKIAVAIAYQHSFLGRPEISLAYCRTALENLPEEDPLWFSWGWYAVGMAQIGNENIVESTGALKKALAFGKKSGNIYLITTIAITLAYNETRLGLYKVSYKRSADLIEFLKENGYAALVKADWTFAVMYANMAAIRYAGNLTILQVKLKDQAQLHGILNLIRDLNLKLISLDTLE